MSEDREEVGGHSSGSFYVYRSGDEETPEGGQREGLVREGREDKESSEKKVIQQGERALTHHMLMISSVS